MARVAWLLWNVMAMFCVAVTAAVSPSDVKETLDNFYGESSGEGEP